MCGIAGWIGPSGDHDLLSAMCDVVAHRGPDGHGSVILPLVGASRAALGHRRLSIIDLEGGDQPMLSFETLTFTPIDRRLVDPALLSQEERDWLNAYHARVLELIGPKLDGDDKKWLTDACEPIA